MTLPVRAVLASAALASAVLASAVLAACGAGRPRDPGGPVDTGAPVYRFPHDAPQHLAKACTACHPVADVLAGTPARPGRAEHSPCDDAKCHPREFRETPGRFCTLCHTQVGISAGTTQPAPYPPNAGP